jgi:hypothetical protein
MEARFSFTKTTKAQNKALNKALEKKVHSG